MHLSTAVNLSLYRSIALSYCPRVEGHITYTVNTNKIKKLPF